jgi:hypothetical protein
MCKMKELTLFHENTHSAKMCHFIFVGLSQQTNSKSKYLRTLLCIDRDADNDNYRQSLIARPKISEEIIVHRPFKK